MITTLQLPQQTVTIDLSCPIDLSIAIQHNAGVAAWYIDAPQINHVIMDGYIGKVQLGGSTNFNDIQFNPHAHGTHTECIGHITSQKHSVHKLLTTTFFKTQLISVTPQDYGQDRIITSQQFDNLQPGIEALIIRTLPNGDNKLMANYSHTNPPYLSEDAAIRFRESGIKHLLIDLPSVDKEKDNGALVAHKAFWNYHQKQRLDATITELIYVPNHAHDGLYMLDLQIASIDNDAAPSRPIIYKML